MSSCFFSLILLVGLCSQLAFCGTTYESRWFSQKLDHYNFHTGAFATYQQRYLFSDAYWGSNSAFSNGTCRGPIIFYTGNESPVTDYWAGSGFVTDVLAPKFGALIIFAEHRYFGESIPFNNTKEGPWSPDNIAYCTSDQALADYAELIGYLKATLPKSADCPVFAVGGSYGGMLTTWLREKYPNVVMGGLSASAPFAFLGSGISPLSFSLACSDTFAQAGPTCAQDVSAGFKLLASLAENQDGWQRIRSALGTCEPISDRDTAWAWINWIVNGMQGMAMLDYPYPTDYGIPLPGWPVNISCAALSSASDPIVGMAAVADVFYNSSGQHACYKLTDGADWGGCCGWDYLACTEVYQPFAQGGIFPPYSWDLKGDQDRCKTSYGVWLDPSWSQTHWGGFEAIKASSRIIFSNGLLDPWHTSGVMQSLSDTLPAIMIPEAAHHLDLRGADPADPPYVKSARIQEAAFIGKWLKEYFTN